MRSHFTEYSAICTIFWKLLSIAYVLCLPFTVENVFSLAYISALSISRFVCIVQCLYSKRVAGGFALVAINIYQRHKNSPPLKLLPFFFFWLFFSQTSRTASQWVAINLKVKHRWLGRELAIRTRQVVQCRIFDLHHPWYLQWQDLQEDQGRNGIWVEVCYLLTY